MRMVSTYPLKELTYALVHNRLDNLSIDICEPNAHHCTQDQEDSQYIDVARLFALPRGDHDADEFIETCPENTIDITPTFLFVRLEA